MNFNRNDYYTSDKFGNMIFNITRCFNDMKMAKTLVDNLDKSSFASDAIKISYSLYITKLYLGHLKEALKLLDYIYRKNEYSSYFIDVDITQSLNEIIDELSFNEGSINKKYLGIRHEAFHYLMADKNNIDSYIDANEKLVKAGLQYVSISITEGKYNYELASDVLTLTKYFNCKEIPKEVSTLYDKVLKILRDILSNIYNLKRNLINS